MRFNKQYLSIVVFLVLLIPFSTAISFSSNPIIFPTNNITTSDSFFCRFTPTDGSVSANITWYRDGVEQPDDNQNTSVVDGVQFQSNTVDISNTAKGQSWNCQVQLNNVTDSLFMNSSPVSIVNALPIIVSVSNQTAYEDAAFSLQMNATDPDMDSIIWLSVDQNSSDYGGSPLFTISTGGLISFTQTSELAVGNHSMIILANDLDDISGIQIDFELLAVNDPPVFTAATLSRTCFEGTLCSYTVLATDEENDSLTFEANESYLGMAGTGFFSFTPNITQVGTHLIEINVTDGMDYTYGVLNLTINSTNHAPFFTYNSTNVSVGVQDQSNNFTFFVNATDIDATDTISFSIDSVCSLTNPWTITRLTNGTNSTQASAMINVNMSGSNDYVACRDVQITIGDGVASTLATFNLNITNTNDAPVIYDESYYSANFISSQFNNNNMKNLSAAKGLFFSFRVNGSDPDSLTYEGETLNYSLSGHDPTLFQINSTTGLITSVALSMNDSYVGNTSFLVIVSDDDNVTFNTSINMSIINNSLPIFSPIDNSNCLEETLCSKDFVASDAEYSNLTFSASLAFIDANNDSFNFTNAQTISLLNITFSSYNVTHTNYSMNLYADDAHVGSYRLVVNYTDDFGEFDSAQLNFSITGVDDIPYMGNNYTALLTDNLTFGVLAENLVFTKIVYGIDGDVFYGVDNLTFNYSYLSSSLPTTLTTINKSATLLTISPNGSDQGNYSLNMTVIDSMGNFSFQVVNFTVYDSTQAPVITQIRPYTNSTNNTVFSFTTSLGSNNLSSVYVNESVATIFDVVASDADNLDMLAYWYENGVLVSTGLPTTGDASYVRTFDFNESGVFNITVSVIDKGIVSYTWLTSVGDVNQQPLFINNLTDLTASQSAAISGTQVFADFFRLQSPSSVVFLDPDDDRNGNGYLDATENNTLSFFYNTSTSCNSKATFTFVGSQLTITPKSVGNCTASFYANDTYGEQVISNTIRVDILDLGQTSSSSSTSSTSSSSSSSTTTVTQTVTVPIDTDVPSSVKFVYPGISSLYDDGTVIIPIKITNNWGAAITDIILSVNASISDLKGELSQSTITSLAIGASTSLNLTFTNYRFDAPIEVNISADIGSLDHVDVATVFINALEKGSYSQEAIKTRVGFARDLLNDNSECAELLEILNDAESETDADASLKLINSVIDGCKYLINTQKAPASEIPQSFIGKIGIYTDDYVDYRLLFTIIIGMTILAVGIGIFSRFRLKKI